MPTPQKPTGLEHFTRLTRSVYSHEPPSPNPQSTSSPHLILLVCWMDAFLRNISKYTAGYEKLYPSSRIVVITTTSIDAAFRSQASNLNRTAPVLEVLHALPPNAKLLVHLFSNGGSYTTTLIAKTYKAKTGKKLPATAVILDSCPGKAEFIITLRAFTVGLPKNILAQVVGRFIFSILFWMLRLVYLVTRRKDLVDETRIALNDKSIMDLDTPRLYAYSVKDVMVPWRYVEEHAVAAENLAYTVHKEKYEGSGHCGHLMSEPERYWGSVTSLWNTVS